MASTISQFNLLDIGLVLIGLVALYLGYHRGFVRQVLRIAALVGGLLLAVRFHGAIARADWMRPIAEAIGIDGAEVLGFAGVLLAVFAAAHLAACAFYGTAKGNAIGGLDRLFGGAFGILKALLLCGLLMLAAVKGGPEDPIARIVEESVLGSRIVRGARQVVRAIPDSAIAPIREFFAGEPRAGDSPPGDLPKPRRDRAPGGTAAPDGSPRDVPPRRPSPPAAHGYAPGPPPRRCAPPIRIAPTPQADRPAPRTGIF